MSPIGHPLYQEPWPDGEYRFFQLGFLVDDEVPVAAERWARTSDRAAATEPARRGLRARFEREADPDGLLDDGERARRAQALMTAHMLLLARASAQARRTATGRGRRR